MSAVIPAAVALSPWHDMFVRAGLKRAHQGKVRDTYSLPDPNLMLVIATDRVSIFDFVLAALVPKKGELLTAIAVFWFSNVLDDVKHHLVAFGKRIDSYLPPAVQSNKELYKRALVVQKLTMVPVECIVRGYLTGSGWTSYQRSGRLKLCRDALPPGLHDGSPITPAFNPTTKAETGHDEPLDDQQVVNQYGSWIRTVSLSYYRRLAAVAEAKGLLLADTKFEFGEGGVLADEVGTPDSSRFWDKQQWEQTLDKSPPPFDKEIVRNWGKTMETPFVDKTRKKLVGLQNLDPVNSRHVAFVGALTVPPRVLNEMTRRYRTVLERLSSNTLEKFQTAKLGAHP